MACLIRAETIGAISAEPLRSLGQQHQQDPTGLPVSSESYRVPGYEHLVLHANRLASRLVPSVVHTVKQQCTTVWYVHAWYAFRTLQTVIFSPGK